jgi:mono/diheme cytochrome c family protein
VAPTASASASTSPQAERAEITFAIRGKTLRSLTRRQLTDAIAVETFTAFDPYYGKPKTYRALPLDRVLNEGFAGSDLALREQHFVLAAIDGYTVPIDGSALLAGGAYIAIEDVDAPQWQPIGPQQANPGPYYLVWRGKDQVDLALYPRPWQLARVEISEFAVSFPHTVPADEPEDSPARRGFAIFREQCIRCHAVNRDGGRVGPDLNVPKSIVEYRPEAQIKAYIRDPRSFRYGNMPSNPHLSDAQLTDLVHYFRAMAKHKFDPEAASPNHH